MSRKNLVLAKIPFAQISNLPYICSPKEKVLLNEAWEFAGDIAGERYHQKFK